MFFPAPCRACINVRNAKNAPGLELDRFKAPQELYKTRVAFPQVRMRTTPLTPVFAFDGGHPRAPSGFAFVPAVPALANARPEPSTPHPSPARPPNARARQDRPPGGILLLALMSGLSGAVMGLLFGGYLTVALTLFLALPLGVGIGIWAMRFSD